MRTSYLMIIRRMRTPPDNSRLNLDGRDRIWAQGQSECERPVSDTLGV